MSPPPARRSSVREVSVRRLLATAALAALLAVGAHLGAGGAVSDAGAALLVALALTGASTWLAGELGRRTRGLSASATLVGAGQGGLELVLWSSGHVVLDPLLATGLHAGASLLLVVVALGADRLSAQFSVIADRSFPAVCWAREPGAAEPGGSRPVATPASDAGGTWWWPGLRPVRGPPFPG